MSGRDAIENRTDELIDGASEEVVLVIGDESLLTEDLVTGLNGVGDGVDLLVGALTAPLQDQIQAAVPDATTFVSGLEWLHGENVTADETAIGRLLLVDRSTILVSSLVPDSRDERAIFGEGFGNGLVVIARRLMAQGLSPLNAAAAALHVGGAAAERYGATHDPRSMVATDLLDMIPRVAAERFGEGRRQR